MPTWLISVVKNHSLLDSGPLGPSQQLSVVCETHHCHPEWGKQRPHVYSTDRLSMVYGQNVRLPFYSSKCLGLSAMG